MQFCLDWWWREREKAIPGAGIHDILEIENTSRDYIPTRAGRKGVLNVPHCKSSQVSSNHLCFWLELAESALAQWMFPLPLLPDMWWGTTSQLLVVSQLLLQPGPGEMSVCPQAALNDSWAVWPAAAQGVPLTLCLCCPKSSQAGTCPPAHSCPSWEVPQVPGAQGGASWKPSGHLCGSHWTGNDRPVLLRTS